MKDDIVTDDMTHTSDETTVRAHDLSNAIEKQ